jgi:hypothetical protein
MKNYKENLVHGRIHHVKMGILGNPGDNTIIRLSEYRLNPPLNSTSFEDKRHV